jgi:glyceraldehyde 3-phosphate dehydrogenase
MKISINGFGRIGRLVLRAFWESSKKYNFEIIAINDLLPVDSAIYLLKYDSVHGKLDCDVQKISETEISIDGKKITYLSHQSPEMLPWKELGIDLVMECTGVFKTKDDCLAHLKAGARKVLISAPSDSADKTIVFGVNDGSINPQMDLIISNASCTTNCLAPIVKTIHEQIGIVNGFATTIHSYTGDQRLVDMNHKDMRRARAAALNMVPTSTGATKAIEKIFPELKGKLSGLSIRVPTPNVSMIDFTFVVAQNTSIKEINTAVVAYSNNQLKDILGYVNDPLVSSDFNHSPLSSIVDCSLTKVIDDRTVHLVAWYDNEWGFSNRMLDTASKML